jgi:RimJ/RimL family protein N-acetyltransferase
MSFVCLSDGALMLRTGFRPTIENSDVILRQWRAADFEFYAAYLGNEATAEYVGGAVDKQKAWRHLASLIGHWTLRGFGVYAVEDFATGQLQGCAGLWQPQGWPCREFAFWFTVEAYASVCAVQATQLAMDEVNTVFPQESVTSFIHPKNLPALALAGELGGMPQGEEPLFDFGPHVRVSYRNSQAEYRLPTTPIEKENSC